MNEQGPAALKPLIQGALLEAHELGIATGSRATGDAIVMFLIGVGCDEDLVDAVKELVKKCCEFKVC